MIFLGALISASNMGCTGLSLGSYIAVYKGHIVGIPTSVDTSISIYGGSPPILSNGRPRDGWKPQHPDTNGFFAIGLTSVDYGENEEPPPHWEGGPLEIFISHLAFKEFHDTLSKEELQVLLQVTPEDAGIKLDKIERGVWVLPDIVLQPK